MRLSKEREERARRRDAIRRLQIGGTGLVLIALLVGLSTLLTDEARQDAGTIQGQSGDTAVTAPPSANDDPLTAPAAPISSAPDRPAAPTAGPADSPLVPDLEPDPELRPTPVR
jgi:type VI protein secretion system component VasK